MKTDADDTDEAEYSATTNTVTAHLGTCASKGNCSLAAGASASFRFRVTIKSDATGTISNQATISANSASAPDSPAMPWPTGNGQQPNTPTTITVTTCSTSADCSASAPYCDTTTTPHQCTCRNNADCPSGNVCNSTSHQCTECDTGATTNCNPVIVGGVCLPGGSCGCLTNTDCGGRQCNIATGLCAAVNADLGLTLTRTPAGSIVAPGTTLTYQLAVTNKGNTTLTGAQLGALVNPCGPGASLDLHRHRWRDLPRDLG